MNISIITAAFKALYLNEVWSSIKKQTHKNWEWILVIDDSAEVLSWYRKMLASGEFVGYDVWAISVSKNRGRYGLVSRNIGAIASSYSWLVFLDDDNEWEEDDYMEVLIKTQQETGKVPYTKLHLVGKKPGSTMDRYKDTHPTRHHIDLGNVFYPKSLFIKVGLFDDSKNKIMFDYDLIEMIKDEIGEEHLIKVDRHLFFRHKRY